MTTKQRYEQILNWFQANMPAAASELHYRNPFELLVAVMLSAQCTDKRVNQVTPALFAAYPNATSMAKASQDDLLHYIRSVSYPNTKAEHLLGTAQRLCEAYGGAVPDTVDALQTLPGVGRKTANAVCAVLYGQAVMPVDTHVFRVSERLGLTAGSKSPLQTEKTLEKHIPAKLIPKAHHWILLHGRYVCQARKPKCDACGLRPYCRFATLHYPSFCE